MNESNVTTNAKEKLNQIEQLHNEISKLKRENQYIKEHHTKNIEKFKE